jgi:hypothetical protein
MITKEQVIEAYSLGQKAYAMNREDIYNIHRDYIHISMKAFLNLQASGDLTDVRSSLSSNHIHFSGRLGDIEVVAVGNS